MILRANGPSADLTAATETADMANEQDAPTDNADDEAGSAEQVDDETSSTAPEDGTSHAPEPTEGDGDDEAEPGLPVDPVEPVILRLRGSGWRLTERKRRQVAVVAAIVVAALVWQFGGAISDSLPGSVSDDGRTPGQTVSGFFHAQAAGDCERLVGLLTEESWSDGGNLSRGQFLDQCAEAVEGYQPNVGAVDVELDDDEGGSASDGDRARVEILSAGVADVVDDDDRSSLPTGRLVREDGEWKVQTDPTVLHVGRSVEETIWAYADAYNRGDCEAIANLLGEDVWSSGGDLDRDGFLDACGQGAIRRDERAQPALGVPMGTVAIDDDGSHATITVENYGSMRINGWSSEEATLVRDGFEWKIEAAEGGDGFAPWAPFRFVHLTELQTELVDDVSRDGSHCYQYFDQSLAADNSPPGVERDFGGACDASLTVYRLGDADEARAFADERATEILEDPPPTAEDLLDNPTSITPEEAAQYAATYRPNQSAPVPGFADAHGIATSCDVDGCSSSTAVVAHDDLVIVVRDLVAPDLDFAAGVLQSQLAVPG